MTNATIGTITQNNMMTSNDLMYNTLYAIPTPTTAPTVTSLVDNGMPKRLAKNSELVAEIKIIMTIFTVMYSCGIMPELIVFTTSPPPRTAPVKTPTEQMSNACQAFWMAPAP